MRPQLTLRLQEQKMIYALNVIQVVNSVLDLNWINVLTVIICFIWTLSFIIDNVLSVCMIEEQELQLRLYVRDVLICITLSLSLLLLVVHFVLEIGLMKIP